MIGRKLGHYKIVEELGGGGMGVVYRAEDTKLGRDVALKVLTEDRPLSDADRRRFLDEARAAAALHHPNICTVHDAGEADGVSYIAMALIQGRSLRDILQEGPLPLARALQIATQIAEALQAAHDRGIVHRDIKSGNIIVGGDDHVTILDFGIAKRAGEASHTDVGKTVGTVAYMSPEQATGGDVDHRTDIWSAGVCLYEMITGHVPFTADYVPAILYKIVHEDPPPLAKRDIPPVVSRIVDRALEKQSESRYASASEMLADLQSAVRGGALGNGERVPSIAVLPFANISDDKSQDYFCDGMAEEIINSLTQIKRMRVVARTSSFGFRNAKLDIRDIGHKLGVDTLLEGSVQKSGKRIRITTQLIDVHDGYHLWSARYDRDLEDVFAIQDEIARNVVQALRVTLTEKEKHTIVKVPTTDIDAYDLYIRAMQHYHVGNRPGFEYARNLFTSAIIQDPKYALAYCGLSDCYAMIATFYDRHASNIENALVASRKALELDGDLAQAHASYGLALSLSGQYVEAEREFLRAIDISPKLFEAYYFYARSCRAQSRLEKAAEMFGKASDVRPEDYQAPILAGDSCRGLDKPDEMHEWFRKGLAAAERHLEHHPREARAWYLGAHAQYELHRMEEAARWNTRAMELAPRDAATLYNAACLFSIMGDLDKCFECFHRAVEHGFSNRTWLESDPDLTNIRSDPRYEALLKSIPE
jgi:serine/threonine protein kinase/tetratricopeptide (TPR) repeat protein